MISRRRFAAVLTGAVARPIAVDAQQVRMPMIGFLNAAFAKNYARQLAAFLKGLAEGGFVDARNVAIEYR